MGYSILNDMQSANPCGISREEEMEPSTMTLFTISEFATARLNALKDATRMCPLEYDFDL